MALKAQLMAAVSPESLPKLTKQLFELMLPSDPITIAVAAAKKDSLLKAWTSSGVIGLT